MKKILFFGTPDIAVPALEKLATLPDREIVGVGVRPDQKIGRKQIRTPSPVKKRALELGLPLVEIDTKQDLKDMFETHRCDLAIVIAFGMIFPKSILDIPPYGVVNVHFSLLPKYRGASPVQSAILAGETVSGITFQKMAFAMDEGDILYQIQEPINDQKTSGLFDRWAQTSSDVMEDFLDKLFAHKLKPHPQNNAEATYCTKFTKKDGEVFPSKETAQEIYRKYRAFDLFPGIFLSTPKGPMKLIDVSLDASEESLGLGCAHETILFIHTAQVPGKTPTPIRQIVNGYPEIRALYQL